MHSTRFPMSFSFAAITGTTSHGSCDLNSRAFIFPCPLGFRLSTIPGPPFVSSLGLRTITHCPAYWRRISARRKSSAVLLLRIGPNSNSSFPAMIAPPRIRPLFPASALNRPNYTVDDRLLNTWPGGAPGLDSGRNQPTVPWARSTNVSVNRIQRRRSSSSPARGAGITVPVWFGRRFLKRKM